MPNRSGRSDSCWTCKLRRKKCDATRPSCLACASRTISCHGYSEDKPDWMDGGERERRELDRIQKLVRENKSRNRKAWLRDCRTRRHESQTVAGEGEGEMDGSDGVYEVEINLPEVQTAESETQVDTPAQHTFHDAIVVDATVLSHASGSITPPTQQPPVEPNISNFRFSHHREAELLMHYLDHVFALQFRFHVPSVSSGGRGWLLWLLTETPPFHRAAISLGALHQHSLLSRTSQGSQHYDDAWTELNEHHNRALSELQVFLQESYQSHTFGSDRMRKLQILACGVAFISFELFRGGVAWEMHLDALTTILSSVSPVHDTGSEQLQAIQTALTEDEMQPGSAEARISAARNPQMSSLEDTAEHFLTSAIVWFETLSLASTGKAPKLLSIYNHLISADRLDLPNIAGFQNWVASIISEVGALRDYKAQGEQSRTLSLWKLFERADDIRKRLAQQIIALQAEIGQTYTIFDGTQIDATAAYLVMADPVLHTQAVRRAVTLVFAHAAQVYLYCTTSDANPLLEEIALSVAATASALQDLRAICDSQVLRSLVWPICVAGCMAHEATLQAFFQGLIEGLGEEAHVFGNSRNVLKVMQTCWAYRAAEEGRCCDWMKAMQLNGLTVLLV